MNNADSSLSGAAGSLQNADPSSHTGDPGRIEASRLDGLLAQVGRRFCAHIEAALRGRDHISGGRFFHRAAGCRDLGIRRCGRLSGRGSDKACLPAGISDGLS